MQKGNSNASVIIIFNEQYFLNIETVGALPSQ